MLGKAILFVFAFTALVSDALAVDYCMSYPPSGFYSRSRQL